MFDLAIREDYKGLPNYRVKTNFTRSMSNLNQNDISRIIESEIRKIRSNYEILRIWNEIRNESVIKKVLFSRKGKPARLLRIFTIIKSRKHTILDDELI